MPGLTGFIIINYPTVLFDLEIFPFEALFLPHHVITNDAIILGLFSGLSHLKSTQSMAFGAIHFFGN